MPRPKPKGYFREDGKTKPITDKKPKGSGYNGQTTDPSWKESSINDLKGTNIKHVYLDADRRVAILQSDNFLKWWQYRRLEDPLPNDPYRAYMIDLSLRARREGVSPWRDQPNRFDVYVDAPRKLPPRRTPRKQRARRRIKPKEWKTPKKTSPERDELQKEADAFCEKYKVPKVTVITHPRSVPMRSYCKTRIQGTRGGTYKPLDT